MRLSTGALLAALSAIVYGSLGVFTKIAYQEGWNVPSLLVARFGLSALVILPLALQASGSWRGIGAAFLTGAFGYAATTALYFPSLRLLPAALAAFLLYLAPVLVALFSFLFLRERLGRRGIGALALAVAGLALMTSGAFVGRISWTGIALAAGSAVTYAATVVVSRQVATGLDWRRASLGVSLGAFTSYLAFSFATAQLVVPLSARGWWAALGLGVIATGIALSLFFAALERIGASRTAIISTLEPVSTLVLAAAFLSEIPDAAGIAGGLLIAGAAALVAGQEEAAVLE